MPIVYDEKIHIIIIIIIRLPVDRVLSDLFGNRLSPPPPERRVLRSAIVVSSSAEAQNHHVTDDFYNIHCFVFSRPRYVPPSRYTRRSRGRMLCIYIYIILDKYKSNWKPEIMSTSDSMKSKYYWPWSFVIVCFKTIFSMKVNWYRREERLLGFHSNRIQLINQPDRYDMLSGCIPHHRLGLTLFYTHKIITVPFK